jgi:hypothetical protein
MPHSQNLNLHSREHGQEEDAAGGSSGGHLDVGCAGESITSIVPSSDNPMAQIISLQSLLGQFAHPKVRADFVNGCFESIDPSLLHQLDELRWTIFPRWQGGSVFNPDKHYQKSAEHLANLLGQSSELLITDINAVEHCRAYCEWHEVLEAISRNKYWTNVPSEHRCTHIIMSDEGTHDSKLAEAAKAVKSMKKLPRRAPSKKDKKKKKANTKIEEIIVSSSFDTSDESSTPSSPENDATSGSDDFLALPHRAIRKVTRDRREVVAPPVFKIDGKIPLKDFFYAYEEYFTNKFKGDEYIKTQKLEEFLEGDMLKVYKIRSEKRLRYNDMKKQLLDYYKKKRVGGKSYWRKQLLAATPEVDESYDIYGLRLVSMAELAFPTDKKECASQLRQQFLNSIAPAIRSKLVDSERSLRAVTGRRQKHFPFSTLIEEAYELQQELPQLRAALYTSHQQSDLQPKSSSFQTQYQPVQSGEFRPQRLTPNARPLDRNHPRPKNLTPPSSQVTA